MAIAMHPPIRIVPPVFHLACVGAYNVATGALVRTSYWPAFTKYDGFVAGDVFGAGKDQMIVITDEDDRLYISK